MPRCKAIGLAPAATFFTPSRKIACARTVAVVVPSPALSLVLTATSRTICAPMFSYLFFSSISLATVTPSLVITGEPNFLPRTTFRPFGPNVTRTTLASTSTPCNIALRASSLNFNSFAGTLVSPYCYRQITQIGLLVRGHVRPSRGPDAATDLPCGNRDYILQSLFRPCRRQSRPCRRHH